MRQRRHRPAARLATLAAVILVALNLAACEGTANHADSLIKRFNGYPILRTPPPGAVQVARGEDKGSNSGITGRDPGSAVIYVTTSPISSVINYYRTSYPSYRISIDCCTTAHSATLVGRQNWVNIGINIASPRPYLIAHYDLQLHGKQPAGPIYITVSVSGQPRGN